MTGSAPSASADLRWESTAYREAPSLAGYRTMVEQHCNGVLPVETAQCVRSWLSTRFEHGPLEIELVHRDHDPAAAFAAHAGGAPAHCMSYSAIVATALRSVGQQARVVQLFPPHRRGHAAVEVRDVEGRWILLDPTSGATLRSPDADWTTAAVAGGAVVAGKTVRLLVWRHFQSPVRT